MHYSQQQTAVTSHVEEGLLRARLQGFITTPILKQALARIDEAEPDSSGDGDARQVRGALLDLSEVSGYGSGTPTLAHRWLSQAEAKGLERVALVANSSVLRTAVKVVGSGTKVDLRCFASTSAALSWVEAG